MSSFFKEISSSPEGSPIKRRPLAKNLAIAGGTLLVVSLAAGGYLYYRHLVSNQAELAGSTPGNQQTIRTGSAKPTPTAAPTPALVASLLTGTMVTSDVANLRPLGAMIENTPEARPQYGLGQADLVYEAVAEGGITRFYAIYGNPTAAIRLEPVRSARPYYVDLSNEIGAFFVHAGGSKDGLAQIVNTKAYDIDGLVLGSPLFKRDTARKVSSEHTLYSSTDALWQYATTTKGWPKTASYSPWLFKDDAASAERPTSQQIKVSVAGPDYAVRWDYDHATNDYKHTQAGIAHIDAGTNKQITAKNIVLQTVVRTNDTESYGSIVKPISRYALTGSGNATIIQNGVTIKGTWKKSSADPRTRFYDTDGKEISFVRGNIWVQLVDSSSTVSY